MSSEPDTDVRPRPAGVCRTQGIARRTPRPSRVFASVPTLPAAFVLFALVVLAGCGGGENANTGDAVRVVTTIGMITDIVEEVGGERVSVEGLMGPGIDPHLYKASAGDVRRLASADVIFYNGLHLEAAMGEVLAEMDGRTRTRAVTDAIDRSLLLRPPEFEGAWDPHVWSDVSLWMSAVDVVRETLTEVDPEGAEEFEARAAAYLEELEALDRWVRAEVAQVPDSLRVLVTAHDAFHYFGQAYGFEVRGLQGLSTATEAGTADVQRLADFIAERGIPALFIETSVPPRNIEAVRAAAQSRGAEVEIGGSLFSDAMGDPDTPEGTYIGMIRANVRTIVDALTPGRSSAAEAP